jgi:transcriptional regulator with XRE-family HTH domain
MQPRRKAGRAAQYEVREFLDLRARLAANTRRLRAAREWTQETAAERCEMLPQHYFRIESGALNTTFTTLARLCRGFGVDVCELLKPTPPRARPRASKRARDAT